MNRRIHTFAWLAIAAGSLVGCNTSKSEADRDANSKELLNVSYDPTRELWKALNNEFIADYKKNAGVELDIKQSHGGSASQARGVIDGLEADVVTLAMWSDTDAISKAGLIKPAGRSDCPTGRCPIRRRSCSWFAKGTRRGSRTGRIW